MSSSLQEQLLKAGIAKPKQAKKARRDKAQRNKAARKSSKGGKPVQAAEQELSREIDAAHAATRAADRQRAQAANAAREQCETKRQAIQIIQANRIDIEAPAEDEPAYSYTIKGRIRKLPVSRDQRRRLADGKLAIVRYDGQTSLVDTVTAERLETIIPKSVFRNSPEQGEATDPDDPYAGYEVPDDLMW